MAARKAGSIIPKGRNKHQIRWFIGRATDGKRRYAARTIEGTYSQAQKALGKETHDVSQGSYVGPSKHTVGEYITRWLRDVAATEVKEATPKSYTVRVKVDVIDRIGGLKLDKVTPQVVQGLCAENCRGMEAHQRQPVPARLRANGAELVGEVAQYHLTSGDVPARSEAADTGHPGAREHHFF